jgi:hypothetical protein
MNKQDLNSTNNTAGQPNSGNSSNIIQGDYPTNNHSITKNAGSMNEEQVYGQIEQSTDTGAIQDLLKCIKRDVPIKSKILIQPVEERFAVIDLYKTNTKSHINKSEVILSILEVLVNWKRYGFHKYNNDIWNKVISLKLGNKIFEQLNLTTLKKYSLKIKRVKDKKAIPSVIKRFEEKIESQE